jgi:replicative DNA helicase
VYAVTLAREAAIRLNYRTLLFSLEMSALDVMARMIAAHATVDLGKILTGKVEDGDWSKIARHQQTIADAPLLIDDTSDVTMAHIRATVRREARRGLRLVIIDYLQLITVSRAESRQTGIDEIARQLKVLARETGVPFLVLSQLNRGPEQRSDKRPMLSDLRESGGLENHPDVVLLLHRPDLYDKDTRPGEADIIVAKHRQGRTGAAPVAFQGHYARFAPMTGWEQRW